MSACRPIQSLRALRVNIINTSKVSAEVRGCVLSTRLTGKKTAEKSSYLWDCRENQKDPGPGKCTKLEALSVVIAMRALNGSSTAL